MKEFTTFDKNAFVLTADVNLDEIAKRLGEKGQLYSLPGVDDKFFVNLDDVHDDIKELLLSQPGKDGQADASHAQQDLSHHAQVATVDAIGTEVFNFSAGNLAITDNFTDFMKLFHSTPHTTDDKANDLNSIPSDDSSEKINVDSLTHTQSTDQVPNDTSDSDNTYVGNYYHNTDSTVSAWGTIGSDAFLSPLGHEALPGQTMASSTSSHFTFLNSNAGETTISGLGGIDFTHVNFGSFNISFDDIGVAKNILSAPLQTQATSTITANDDTFEIGESEVGFFGHFSYSDLLSNDTTTGSGPLTVTSLNFTFGGSTTVVPVPADFQANSASGPGFDFTLLPSSLDFVNVFMNPVVPPPGLSVTYTVTDGTSTAEAAIHFVAPTPL